MQRPQNKCAALSRLVLDSAFRPSPTAGVVASPVCRGKPRQVADNQCDIPGFRETLTTLPDAPCKSA